MEPLAKGCPDEWLHDIAASDRKLIQKVVQVTGINWRNISNTLVPRGDFVFFVTNVSVFPIALKFDEETSLPIRFGTYEFVQKPELQKQESKLVCNPRTDTYFTIRQMLYQQEADLITNAPEREEFFFGGLRVVIQGAGEFASQVEERRLDTNYTVSKRTGTMLKHYL